MVRRTARTAMMALAALGLLAAPHPGVDAYAVERIHDTQRKALPGMGPSFKETVRFDGAGAPGTIIIATGEKALYVLRGAGLADRYRISIGREGFGWTGMTHVGAKKEWPEWRPPAEMRAREPGLPEFVPAGPYNPLGARALYLYRGNRDTLYRIHGTNNPDGVGFDGTSGCFRLTNTDIIELFERIPVGTKVIVR